MSSYRHAEWVSTRNNNDTNGYKMMLMMPSIADVSNIPIYIHIDFSSARKEAKLNCILALCVFVYTLLYGSTSLSLATIILCVYAHELRLFSYGIHTCRQTHIRIHTQIPNRTEQKPKQKRNNTKEATTTGERKKIPILTKLNWMQNVNKKNVVLCVFPTLSVRKCDLMCFEAKAQQEFWAVSNNNEQWTAQHC